MIKSACNLMKKASAFTVFLILIGSLLVLVAQFLPMGNFVPAMFLYLGFILVHTGLFLLLITLIALLFPRVNERLEQCQH